MHLLKVIAYDETELEGNHYLDSNSMVVLVTEPTYQDDIVRENLAYLLDKSLNEVTKFDLKYCRKESVKLDFNDVRIKEFLEENIDPNIWCELWELLKKK